MSRDRLITVPLPEHHTEARVMAEALARQWGVEEVDVRPEHVDMIAGHLGRKYDLGAQAERAHLEHLHAEVRQGMSQLESLHRRVMQDHESLRAEVESLRQANAELARRLEGEP